MSEYQFTESWRQLRRNTGELLAMSTRGTELERFRTFLRECVQNEWMAKNGAERIRFKNQETAKEDERYGLELEEYEQMMAAADAGAPPLPRLLRRLWGGLPNGSPALSSA